jgi:hypothetical protein
LACPQGESGNSDVVCDARGSLYQSRHDELTCSQLGHGHSEVPSEKRDIKGKGRDLGEGSLEQSNQIQVKTETDEYEIDFDEQSLFKCDGEDDDPDVKFKAASDALTLPDPTGPELIDLQGSDDSDEEMKVQFQIRRILTSIASYVRHTSDAYIPQRRGALDDRP